MEIFLDFFFYELFFFLFDKLFIVIGFEGFFFCKFYLCELGCYLRDVLFLVNFYLSEMVIVNFYLSDYYFYMEVRREVYFLFF